ncbi:MAG: tetratricopeptide repeat protein, partial [Akkermansiaceae bacterium]|nr:tetratricopeptide repeat protein [Akkermansiaceae bacterium]
MHVTRIIVLLAAALLPAGMVAQAPEETLRPDPAADLFLLAELAYQEALDSKDPKLQAANFEAALRQFTRFLEAHAGHPNAEKAWYYSAVCAQKTGKEEEARRALATVVSKWKRGPLVGAAAFQLANHHYDRKEYAKAEPLYVTAIMQSDSPPTRHLARYRRALCFQELGKIPETIKALERGLVDDDSPFRGRAEAALPHFYKKVGRREQALALFEKLAASGADEKIRAEATLQTALLARDLNMAELAEKWFEKILVTPGLDEYRGEAQLALMSEASQAGDHKRVVALFERGAFRLKKEQLSRRILLAIKSYEALGQAARTDALYLELQRIAPDGQTALEAAYVLLTRRYQKPGPEFAGEARRFLDRYGKSHPDDARIHSARLMLGEVLFKAGKFREAAEAYAGIDFKHVEAGNHAGLRYRLATARLKAGDRKGALAALDDFLERHPDDSRVEHVYVKRAELHAGGGDDAAALRDLDALLAITKDATLREYAWAEKAGIFKKAKDYRRMITAHERLRSDFPKRDPAKNAASEFWIAWAHFRLDEFEPSVEHFLKARDADPKALGRDATVHLALVYYSLQQQEALQAELNRLLENYPKSRLPRAVFAWLGVKLSSEGRHQEAWRYLQRGVSTKSPGDTKTVAWRAFARAAVESGHFREALAPVEILLERDDNEFRRAESFYLRARAHFGLGELAPARDAAEAGLELKPQGLLNARLRLILGDIAMAGKDPQGAAEHYVVVAELYSPDAATRTEALTGAIKALDQIGTPESRAEAGRYRTAMEKQDIP